MKNKLFYILIALLALNSKQACAQDDSENSSFKPVLSGSILYQLQADQIINSASKNIKGGNGFGYIEPNFGLHFDKNWSVKTQWRIQNNGVFLTRDKQNPERYRNFLDSKRGFEPTNTGLLIEELKINYENEDMKFSLGKLDPTFGTAHRKSKRIGVFAWQMAEDYNLREKIGANVTAILEGAQISFSTFFNDSTDLSRSAIQDRGRQSSNNGLAGNTSRFSSYAISMEGENLFSIENLFYNFGFRSLGVDNVGRKREAGYVFGSEYLYKVGRQSSIIPFVEIVRIKNFTGENGRTGNYATVALIGKYSSWTASSSIIFRNIKRPNNNLNLPKSSSDKQIQFSVGYKFNDNLTLDVTRAIIKENGISAGLVGGSLNYLYKF